MKEPLYMRLIQAGIMLIYIFVLFEWTGEPEMNRGARAVMVMLAGLGISRLSARPGSARRNWIVGGLMGAALLVLVIQRLADQ